MPPRRVLFIAEGQLGDLLLMTPALRAVKCTFPHATVSVLVLDRRGALSRPERPKGYHGSLMTSGLRTALGANPHVSDVTVIDRRALRSFPLRQRMLAEIRIVLSLRSQEYDTVICTFPEDRFVVWAFLSGASVRVGQKQQAFSRLLTHRPDVQKRTRGVLEYYCDLARALGAHADSLSTEYHIPREADEWAGNHFRVLGIERVSRLVAVHPGATGEYKIWPPERYAAVINALDGFQGIRTALFCGPADVAVVEEIVQRTSRPPTVLKTEGNLPRFAGLLRRCSLLISNDSGPRHLAVALGVPTIAPFRKFHDQEWKVYADSPTCVTLTAESGCTFCPVDACLDRIPEGERFGSHCLRMVSVEQVVASAKRILL